MAKVKGDTPNTGNQWPSRGTDNPPAAPSQGTGVGWPACGVDKMPGGGDSHHPGQHPGNHPSD